jgi:hypothetical protein
MMDEDKQDSEVEDNNEIFLRGSSLSLTILGQYLALYLRLPLEIT